MVLKDTVFTHIPVQELKPQGWILNQLKIQANGISGNLDKFWPDIKDSKWIGGTAEGWERVPYWLDGFIPLAWLLDNEDMKTRARFYIEEIIKRQESDGWLCPTKEQSRESYDMWALILLLKVFIVYYEVAKDERIEGVVYKALKAFNRHLDGSTLFGWGSTRWFEVLIPVYWLYKRKPEQWLEQFINKITAQGFDWISFFENSWPYENISSKDIHWSFYDHVVNNAMMLKSGALLSRISEEEHYKKAPYLMQKMLDSSHGMITGVFTGDECLAGKSPIQGTELCAVVENMYSLEHLIEITGDIKWADRLERIAFNALPATFSPDMWTHQYDQQVNQVQCSVESKPVFRTNGGEANTFGVEPHYGCCTANLSQGWPKFVLSSYMKSTDGIVVNSYLPCELNTTINGIPVKIITETEYPFREDIKIRIITMKSIDFTIYLRIPEWVDYATISIGEEVLKPPRGIFYKLSGTWSGETEFDLKLHSSFILNKRPSDLYAITCGPLVYSLPIGEHWEVINKDKPYREFPHCDYAVFPTTDWNYALCIADKNQARLDITFEEKEITDTPFSPANPPIIAYIQGKKVNWELINGSCAPVPDLKSPMDNDKETIKLIPYGCTNLRMTEMPVVK
ncbi:MAG: hypothetical protein K0S55_937 [Clostridia bacterium]|nr:hypothetical protein [Clostridia bacterium]